MKKLIFTLIIFTFLLSIDIKVIKYKTLDDVKYDWFDTIYPLNGYMSYTKKTVFGVQTNYIHGKYKIIDYKEYLKENRMD